MKNGTILIRALLTSLIMVLQPNGGYRKIEETETINLDQLGGSKCIVCPSYSHCLLLGASKYRACSTPCHWSSFRQAPLTSFLGFGLRLLFLNTLRTLIILMYWFVTNALNKWSTSGVTFGYVITSKTSPKNWALLLLENITIDRTLNTGRLQIV